MPARQARSVKSQEVETEKLNKVTVSMLFLPCGTEPLLDLGDQGWLSCGRWRRGAR